MRFGDHVLWEELDLALPPGQFVAVLGPNGCGKSTLLRVLLGQQRLTTGAVNVLGAPARRGSDEVGFVPQRVTLDAAAMVKARDVVRLGLDGHRWGVSPFGRAGQAARLRVDELLADVEATAFAEAPVSMLSGGEVQRIRIASALAADPQLLLCDEPLAALDLRHQQAVAGLIERRRREHGTTIMFVTHDINSVLEYVDQVLYLANGKFRLGAPADVLTSESLTSLYGAPIDVLHVHGRVVVVGADVGNDLMVHDPHHVHGLE